MIIIIDHNDSFTYNLANLIADLKYEVEVINYSKFTEELILSLDPEVILFSPGPQNPNEYPKSLQFIERERKIPIIGVCLGHQMISQVYGGSIVRGVKPMQGVISKACHNNDSIFLNIPECFEIARYHSLCVEIPGQSCIEVLAVSEDKVPQIIKISERKIIGIQFHPESVGTPDGKTLISNILKLLCTNN